MHDQTTLIGRLFIGFTAMLPLVATGCNAIDFIPLVTTTSTSTEEFKTSATPKVVVETFNGTIDVSDGESDEVVVEVTRRAGGVDREAAEAALDQIQVTMEQKGDTIHVVARSITNRPGNLGASVVIAAPKAARLKLHSSNGGIVCEGMTGGLDANTSNAKVTVVEAAGTIRAHTSNGPIEIEATDAVVDAHSSNASIRFTGALAEKDQQFKTSNARIEMALPSDSKFRLDSSTSNGRIRCDFPLVTEGKTRRTRLNGTVGGPSARSLAVSTSNASIDIHPQDKADKSE